MEIPSQSFFGSGLVNTFTSPGQMEDAVEIESKRLKLNMRRETESTVK
jgi:hypothetical protein